MDDKIKLKKYFIKDVELTSMEEDRLHYEDAVKNLSLIIDNTKPPFSIAVTGKSGSGKSSIINFLTEKYKNDSENYNVEKINVWKDDISIQSFLDAKLNKIDDNNQLKNEKVQYVEQTSVNSDINKNDNSADSIKGNKKNNDNNKNLNKKSLKILLTICNSILAFVACFFITSVIFVIMEYFNNRNIYQSNDIFFVENTYINYCENIGLIMLFSLVLTVIGIVIHELFIKKSKNGYSSSKLNYQENTSNNSELISINNSDENVNLMKTNIAPKVNADLKNIIIIEDIDKLTVSKMLKTLEEIKYCNEYENCIFIVPFDKNILKKAIAVKNKINLSAKYKPLKFEKVLDKVFQFKVYVPRISVGDFKDYAIDLVQEKTPNFVDEYCQIETFEKIIKNILIYKNVTTPRHVKKVINNFVNNRILASYRVESGRIDESIINTKKFDYQLAKISVLQSDFEEFYDLLFKNFSYLDKLSELYCLDMQELKEKYNDIDEELKPFLTVKYKPLKSFLIQTRNCKIDNIATLMYLTQIKEEKMFKGIPVSNYISGNESISNLNIKEVLELVRLISNREDLNQFTANNFKYLLNDYESNAYDKSYFITLNKIVNILYENIDEPSYIKYLEIVAINYNSYPDEALEVFENLKIEIPGSIMTILIKKIENNLSTENYDNIFEFVRDNSDCFYEEDGNVSDYVQFLVDYISMSSNPNEVIQELDDNFNRIGKVYELNNNIKELENLDFDKAYTFMAKCLDNGDFDRMVYVINTILSDENSVDDSLKIEEKMNNYKLADVIECDVDDMLMVEYNKLDINTSSSDDDTDVENRNAIENAKLIKGNYILLRNILEVCSIKQADLDATDVMKIAEKALENVNDNKYVLSIYTILKKFDRMYFYEIRRDFNLVIYASFHTAKNNAIKEAALECTRYFKNTRLFKTKLTKEEERFYSEN